MFQDFDGSKTARRYVVNVKFVRAYDGQLGRFVNKDTSEALVISHSAAVHSVKVERKPMDEK